MLLVLKKNKRSSRNHRAQKWRMFQCRGLFGRVVTAGGFDQMESENSRSGISFKGISKGQKKGQNMIEYVFFADLFFDVFWTNNRPQ